MNGAEQEQNGGSQISDLKTPPKRLTSLSKVESHKTDPERDLVEICVADEPGPGGANHEYMIYWPAPQVGGIQSLRLSFQKGPIQEVGVNGITQEVLLAIVAHRLECFQKGAFACEANAVAWDHVEAALKALHERTRERRARGVEGKSKV